MKLLERIDIKSGEENIMSLRIETSDIIGVLMSDGWHSVVKDSFEIDSYEFIEVNEKPPLVDTVLIGGGSVEGISATGARWQENEMTWIACAITQILAVKTSSPY